ncbi:MAG TPA: FAD-dependent oxidoreductase [Candidatus Cloacimonas sp.]|nr:FAD-dependent oxidoreductase [Candidatus Cloacimonas sp.]HPS60522.1 FAD-dependent oxidoreductase [Candidatus Cloacimonas sp.]
MNKIYDVIVIGAGSIGLPTAYNLAKAGRKVLVIEPEHSPGQGNNKKAIGGVRATHSDLGKINVCLRSIEILKNWQEETGDDIGWLSNGYSYPAYNEKDALALQDLMQIQLSFGLNIQWLSPDEYSEIVPGILKEGLQGSTFSPEDGSCSPLLVSASYFEHCQKAGVDFHFQERVTGFDIKNYNINQVITDKGIYSSAKVVNAAGGYARDIGQLANIDLPVFPENHEAGITEPVERFFGPMVIDMRLAPGSANFYFYQNSEGQIVFCITPDPPVAGINMRSTSVFLPMCSKRMLTIYPRLRNLKVRRTWRGQYPMTPDGFPVVGIMEQAENLVNAVGMCGQGFMLGPGMGELVTRICLENITDKDRKILESFDTYRQFTNQEAFK